MGTNFVANTSYLSTSWYTQFRELVDKNRQSHESDYVGCKELAPKLSAAAGTHVDWSPSYLLHVLKPTERSVVGPSPVFTMAVENLYRKQSRKKRKDKLRLYVPFSTRAEIAYIEKHLTPADRRDILLAAASHEDFD